MKQTAIPLTQLLLEAAGALRTRLDDELQSVELSLPKYELLQQLADSDEPIALSSLAAERKCAASNITQLVDRLEADGLVRRTEDSADRRTKRAELTALGKTRRLAGARVSKKVQAALERSLSDTDRRALARILSTII